MNNTLVFSILVALLFALILGAGMGYLFGYDHGVQTTTQEMIDSFEECAAAGYPVMESYPEQCRTPDGQLFIREIPEENEIDQTPISRPTPQEPMACPADAKICPDGTGVGRSGPNCEFAPCPGE
ncbi:hypothetical protein K2Y00_01730 [Patescibacteria group bacterium]|nr:hypothetical protein [Patescibacteria group bacterium]